MRDGRYQFRRYDDPFRQLLRSVPAAMSRTHHFPNVVFHGTCDAEASHYAQTTSEVTGFDPISIYAINFNFSMIYDRSRESDILPKKGCFNLKLLRWGLADVTDSSVDPKTFRQTFT